ncbi:hypothetical protein Rsub_04415 [Raphidocelis subcapitata]|uniref:JmjC domain-containing protein n=1 Tax=Raphidocelis subcapitata TaxID=307507 RepID=A0A2V0NWQ0_9CHLO|nr:hypothetical protein Rsub_04415 [Raphidocelis subcapitata]|eukprot:GBF92068.1 hypothetical protein Rsub_04415 [Raphidocelis subcapitata]
MGNQGGGRVDAISLEDAVDGLRLWKGYVSQRKPVLIKGVPGSWGAEITDNLLIREAGKAKVLVEVREGARGTYGLGRKAPMRFGDFVRRAAGGDGGLYLSTQQARFAGAPVAPDGHPELTAPPVTQLLGHLPLQPAPLPHLVPQSINMWMGAATEGSSTGLHHDFHDNLYVLLRGRKRFRLYPPSSAAAMGVRGRVARVHANGRIVYEGQGDVAADGSDKREVARWRARRAAEAAVASAEAAAARREPGAAAALAAAEAQLEAALDRALGSDDFDADAAAGEDDYECSDDGAGDSSDGSSGDDGGGARRSQVAGGAGGEEEPPPSFSRVDLSLPPAELRRRHPSFPGAGAAIVAEVAAGQCLYLPAGWFHEVTSYSDPGCATHLAFNWWFHPPDNLAPTNAAFKQPYTSDYWPSLWAARKGRLQALQAAARARNGGQPQTEPQRQQQQQQQRQGQRRPALAPPPAKGVLRKGRARRKGGGRIHWRGGVADVANRYYRGMTHEGTASGSAAVWPPPRERGQQAEAAAGGGGGGGEGGGEAGAEEPEDAVAAYFRANPQALQALLAQLGAGGGGGGRGGGGGGGGGGGAQGPQGLPRRSPLAAGRRHHIAVAVRIRKRVPKPDNPMF